MKLNHFLLLLFFCAANLPGDDTSDLIPKHGRGNGPSTNRSDGPWATRILLATSTNGLDFRRLQYVVSDQATAPNVILDHEQRARIYYTDFGNQNVLACALQEKRNSLTNWIYRHVHLSGLAEDYRDRAIDPAVVTVPGGRYRLYFAHRALSPSIHSAISTNGIDFVKEEGVRLTLHAGESFGPTPLKTTGHWLLWSGSDARLCSRSADGLNFTAIGEFRVEGARFMPWSAAVLPNGGGYRLYGNFSGAGEWSGGISSAISRDGENWKREPGIRLSLDGSRYSLESRLLPQNGCAFLPDGRCLMAYLATIPRPRGR